MRNRSSQGLDNSSETSKGILKSAKLAPAVLAALLSTQSRAETYVCDIDIDTEIDGIAPSGSAINDGSINYTATPCDEGVCFRTIDDGTGTNTIVEMSTDLGATFTNITSDLETLDSSLIGGI